MYFVSELRDNIVEVLVYPVHKSLIFFCMQRI